MIVTLGSFSLFRGLAEGLTGGVDNFTHFPELVPVPGPGLFAGRHSRPGADLRGRGRGVLGAAAPDDDRPRHWSAIGFSPEGARYAGLPVERLVGLVYVLSGLVASLAAIIYVAHLGQAKADAGTGYELPAITAVVLGGTSIFGGRGSVAGTLARPVRDRRASKRPAPGRPARRAGRRLDRNACSWSRSGSTARRQRAEAVTMPHSPIHPRRS